MARLLCLQLVLGIVLIHYLVKHTFLVCTFLLSSPWICPFLTRLHLNSNIISKYLIKLFIQDKQIMDNPGQEQYQSPLQFGAPREISIQAKLSKICSCALMVYAIIAFFIPWLNIFNITSINLFRYYSVQGTLFAMDKFPMQTRNQSVPWSYYDYQEQKDAKISDVSVEIAKQYIRLGLIQPSFQELYKQKNYYQSKYSINNILTQQLKKRQLPICIVSQYDTNALNDRYKFNLNSIYRQQYSNFHIVVIDDASLQKIGQKVKEYLKEKKFDATKITLVINQHKKGALKNYDEGISTYCKPHQIVILIDGNDGLVGAQTLKFYNHIYQTTDTWLTYGGFIYSVFGEHIGQNRPIPQKMLSQNSYRDSGILLPQRNHPSSFYAELFNLIKKQDLQQQKQLKQGEKEKKYYQIQYDQALLFPMVQMAQKRALYVPQILCIVVEHYNSPNQTRFLDKYQVIQQIIHKSKYQPKKCLFATEESKFKIKIDQSKCPMASDYSLRISKANDTKK